MKNEKSVITQEISTYIAEQQTGLAALRKQIDERYYQAFELLFHCKGKVIVAGVGKSGIIAKKIAATLASTGTTAVYLHAGEAMHGDLGVSSSDDVIMIISRGGGGVELAHILPVFKALGCQIIAITANPDSLLAEYAKVTLCLPALAEACPHNLAPTTSTTLSLVIGDALAMCLMKKRGFSSEDFALYHPGGALGKRLLCQVADIMRTGEQNPVIGLDATVKEMLLAISSKLAGAVSVVGSAGELVGLITDCDVRHHLEQDDNIFEKTVADLLNRQPMVVYTDESAYRVLLMMQDRKRPFSVMPVLDRVTSQLIGMVTLQDLLAAGLR